MTKLGDNTHGLLMKDCIINELSEKSYVELNDNFKKFLNYITNKENVSLNESELLSVLPISSNNQKQDFVLGFSDISVTIRVKTGDNNSVHQEKIAYFTEYLEKLGASSEVCDAFRLLVWSDGTLDGTGPLSSRMTLQTLLTNYPNEKRIMTNFLQKEQLSILKRALSSGRQEGSKVDYYYHGNTNLGVWASCPEMIKFHKKHPIGKSTLLPVGRLEVQSWNVSLNGLPTTEEKRGSIQFKYTSLESDLRNILNKR